MPPSFATNPLTNLLRHNNPISKHHSEEPSSPRFRRPSSPNLSPRALLKRTKLITVKLPRAPSVPSLSLRRTHSQPHHSSNSGTMEPATSTTDNTTPPPDYVAPENPTELLVLAHGLQGTVEDFTYLLDELRKTPAAKGGRLLVHASRVNTDKTHDGIILGGLRLAEDIRAVVAKYKSLEYISLMGFSLGGLYVRYAAGHLYNAESGLVAGLKARKMIIVASPNLGVRSFGVYRFLPTPVQQMGHLVLGVTGTQLLLQDDEQLLMAMTSDRNRHGMQFVSALKCFSERWLYANVRNDFMVNYGTAALDHTVQVMDADAETVVREKEAAREAVAVEERVDDGHDERGCRICFQLRYEGGDGEGEGSGNDDGKNVSEGEDAGGEVEEEVMSKRLKKVGWSVVGVDFPLAMPIAHNRIVAMSRNAIHTWMNGGGRRVVHHLVDTFSSGFDEHERRFIQVRSSDDAGKASANVLSLFGN